MKYLPWIGALAALVVIVGAIVTTTSYFNEIDERVTKNEKQISKLSSSSMTVYMKRKWCDMRGERKLGENYRNKTGLPIELAVSIRPPHGRNDCRLAVYVNSASVLYQANRNTDSQSKYCGAAITIPPENTYRIDPDTIDSVGQRIESWWELRPSCDVRASAAHQSS